MRIKIKTNLSNLDILRTRLAVNLISLEGLTERSSATSALVKLVEPVTRAILRASYDYGYFALPPSLVGAYYGIIPEWADTCAEYDESLLPAIVEELKSTDTANSATYEKAFAEYNRLLAMM